MSELDTRPATRGRGSVRGRGGFSGRGGPRGGSKRINGTSAAEAPTVEESFEDQGEIGDMRRKYASQLPVLKDMFTEWTDVDLLFALQEHDGDLAATVDRISQGNVSQFSEVNKKKDRARSRAKEEPAAAIGDKPVGSIRGSRGRGGLDGGRGRGGRGSDRGRGGHRGGRGGHATTNGAANEHAESSIPTTESSAWDTAPTETTTTWSETSAPAAAPAEPTPASSGRKTWASMFSAPKLPLASKAPATTAQEPPAQLEIPQEPIPEVTTPAEILTEDTQPAILAAAIIQESIAAEEEAQLPPAKDSLTQENVEHLPDESHPPATHTAASTIDSNDPRNLTPLPGQPPIGRPPLGGFATSAQRAAGSTLRSASYQRRVQEQQEAVVMPGHNALDRAAVQFGSMGLNGEPGLDVDDEREDPETRQAPQHSPPSQPKASLPPSMRQTAAPADPTAKPPGLPPASQLNAPSMQEAALQQEQSQLGHGTSQYGGYGQSGYQGDAQTAQSKQYDPFSSQGQPQYDRFGQQIQPQQSGAQSHQGFGGLPSGQHDYSSYYNSDQHRNPYGQYYGSSNAYAQDNRGQTHASDAQARSGYGSAPADPSYAAQAQQQSRYAEGTSSGNATPNPQVSAQPQNPQQSGMHPQQGQGQGYATNAAGFPYGHPYFNSPYAQAYQNQFGYNGGYGGGYPAQPQKSGSMYGAPQGYASGYEQHASSPANANAYTQNQQQSTMRSGSGTSGLGSGPLDEYGRNTAQTSAQGAGSYLAMSDPFARTPSGFGQTGYGGQMSSTGVDDSLKPFADQKAGSSPALTQPGRPGSAANSANAGQPHPQQGQGSFGQYQAYPGQSSQYGGLGGLGGHQGQQTGQGQYGQYGASNFSQYGSYNSRGGWGQSYGGH